MTPQQFLDHLATDSAHFASAAAGTLDQAIPSLGWTVRELTAHLGGVYTYGATNAAAASPDPAALGPEARAPEGDAINDWFVERRTVLLETLSGIDDDAVGWTHAGPQKGSWWKRRMACETSIHRFDLEAALADGNEIDPIDSELATAGVDEYLTVSADVAIAQPGRNTYPAKSLHLHRSDGPGEWMLTKTGDGGLLVTHEHGKGDAAVRGPASELFLWVWGRPATDVQIFGDEAVAEAWRTLAS